MKKILIRLLFVLLWIIGVIIWNFGGAFLCVNLLHLTEVWAILFMLIWGGFYGISTAMLEIKKVVK
jgi:hypothetical protein